MERDFQGKLQRWQKAGLLDASAADAIFRYEKEEKASAGLRWPVLLAWVFGGVLIGAGALLFVAAHWQNLSPTERFSLVLLMVAVFHLCAGWLHSRAPALARVLHAIGTVSLGAGIFLAGQIFHLQEHWPGGVMLWALGAWIAWLLLDDWAQGVLVALLTPCWLVGEWIVATQYLRGYHWILASGLTLLSLVYFTARTRSADSPLRRGLMWLGGLALIPSTFYLALQRETWGWYSGEFLPSRLSLLGWVVAIGLPLAVGNLLRRRIGWEYLAAGFWVVLLGATTRVAGDTFVGYAWKEMGPYLLCGGLSLALAWWGLAEGRRERINMGVAGFGLTVVAFYFATVMDKLGRSFSLMLMGLLFLVVGWGMHRARRELLARLEAAEKEVRS